MVYKECRCLSGSRNRIDFMSGLEAVWTRAVETGEEEEMGWSKRMRAKMTEMGDKGDI